MENKAEVAIGGSVRQRTDPADPIGEIDAGRAERTREPRRQRRIRDERLDGSIKGQEAHIAAGPVFPHSGTRLGRTPVLQERTMTINKSQIKGRVTEAKGKIKEVTGKLVGNERLEAKGKIEKVLGETQAKFGDIKADLEDATKKRI
jgi:uncharacterized protein YjbJ (UPF0337 family)